MQSSAILKRNSGGKEAGDVNRFSSMCIIVTIVSSKGWYLPKNDIYLGISSINIIDF